MDWNWNPGGYQSGLSPELLAMLANSPRALTSDGGYQVDRATQRTGWDSDKEQWIESPMYSVREGMSSGVPAWDGAAGLGNTSTMGAGGSLTGVPPPANPYLSGGSWLDSVKSGASSLFGGGSGGAGGAGGTNNLFGMGSTLL